jgi:hypothetical protein
MIYRLRNILNWVAFVALVSTVGIFCLAVVGDLSGLYRPRSYLSQGAIGLMEFTLVLYPLWVLIQYIIWKHPVFIPWHFKDDEE